ncbi:MULTISPECIES: cyanophycinase [Fischerella]|jgi:cyanophycinase|uniref:Cyanophycinase n=4 Tax=Fischerella TaxID=1190 RepID=A0A2N6KK19_9CYAN|nr:MULTISPECIES: cyanophycinase [Fischerella]PLZ77305.1 cyanophycinase [Fischerella thermalis WC217]PMB01803.1 cyanophycinase [Fischerella thermalis CCMEE 5196]PMB08938.1 cyanophycinase [Fischerella thermalis CCMEE 5273]PMB48660.1 cyanophycinase [Fischerella thermalis CCMEE 5201]BCX06709.1 MAG: cyanophycinase [Fischerella sp.]
MPELQAKLLEMRTPQATKTAVLVIGGAEDKVHGREILRTFFARAGANDAHIAIIPSASREPSIIGGRYIRIFEDMGAKKVELLDIREREQCEYRDYQQSLEACTGVFLTGGDQLRLCGVLSDTPAMDIIRQRVRSGELTLAGTSAGAAVMGHHMIAGGGSGESPNRSLVDMATGLGFIPEVIVDQHFNNRNRMGRLMSAIASHPDRLGIGIDEDTCALFERDGWLQVLGKGSVTIIDPTEVTHTNEPHVGATEPLNLHNLRLHILSHGDRFHLYQRTVLPAVYRISS